MWIQRLHVRHAPGLPAGVALTDLRPGPNLVVGPNASGKSTLARALRATLWPSAAQPGVTADATWRHGDVALEVSLHGDRATWSSPPPPLPDATLSARYRLGLAELLRAGEVDARLARALARELAGGYDVDAAQATFGDRKLPPRDRTRALTEAEAALRRAEQEAVALADEEKRAWRPAPRGARRRSRQGRLLPALERLRDAAEARPAARRCGR
ncbi:MAG: AAA family ATPase [Myxococcales bacterium]|nr:AAA family ATPase [Myxococcales bacterium]